MAGTTKWCVSFLFGFSCFPLLSESSDQCANKYAEGGQVEWPQIKQNECIMWLRLELQLERCICCWLTGWLQQRCWRYVVSYVMLCCVVLFLVCKLYSFFHCFQQHFGTLVNIFMSISCLKHPSIDYKVPICLPACLTAVSCLPHHICKFHVLMKSVTFVLYARCVLL